MKHNVLAGLVISVLASQSSMANSLNNYDAARRLFDVSYQLNQIAEVNSTDLCAGDVTIAGAYLEAAGRELQHDKTDKALVSLTYGQNELKQISNTRSYCAHLSPQVKPYLARVIVIRSEIETTIPPDIDQTSD